LQCALVKEEGFLFRHVIIIALVLTLVLILVVIEWGKERP
jgi:hypothetical protein